ncbi:MAG: amino acid ABC transporter permease [Acidaminococcaceae bacterium]|nr:amino acid ABC transporter permease [Acidaminococcaceae bacterium]
MDYIIRIIPQMGLGALESLKIFSVVIVLSLPLGMVLALGRISGFSFIKKFIATYVWVLRGSPLMLQMLFVYFALPSIGILFEDFTAAIIAFVLNYAAYFCEIFRGGIQAIPKGQYEAAHALGMNYWQTLRRIVLPQVFRIVLPPISNETITLVKDTSLVYVLAMNDLMRTTRNLVQRDFSVVPFLVAAIFYLGATLLLTILFERLEKYYAKSSAN